MSDRIFAGIMLVVALYYGWEASFLEVPLASDPLGSKAFPLFLSVSLFVLSVPLLLNLGKPIDWPRGLLLQKFLLVLATLAVYGLTLPWLGFIISTMLMASVIARLFYATWGQSAISSIVFGVGSYVLFRGLLHIPLPIGQIFGV
jgi:putative tricarboxylic transport membrane protein